MRTLSSLRGLEMKVLLWAVRCTVYRSAYIPSSLSFSSCRICFIQNYQIYDNGNHNNNNDGKKMNFNCDTTYRYCLQIITFFLINFLFLLNKKRLRERERFEKKCNDS